jgi:hypothetical protein
MFGLDDQTRIFVVAADPFQEAGPDNDRGPEAWNAYRGWDGMSELTAAFEAISPSALPGWRHAAGQRYWARALDETMIELRKQLAEYTAQAEVAARGVDKRDAWESELDALDRAAQAALEGLGEDVMRRSWEQESATADLKPEIERAIGEWFTQHEARLERLRQSIRKSRDRERAQPSWAGFADLVARLESGETPVRGRGAAGHVETIGGMAIGVLKAYTDAPGHKTIKKAAKGQFPEKLGRHIGTAEAALPLAVYLTGLIGERWADRGRRNQEKAAAEQRQQIAADFTRRARDTWQPFVDDIRAEIVAQTGDQVDLHTSLRQLVDQLHDAVTEGEKITFAAS